MERMIVMATSTSRGTLSLAATVLTATIALYMALVAFGNITDFGTNQQFVRHVLAMDTTFKDEDLMWRAVTSQGLQDAAYVGIIVWETVAALVLIYGSWLWARRDDLRARRMSTYGLLMVMLLFGAMEFDRGLLIFAYAGDRPGLAEAARWLTELGGADKTEMSAGDVFVIETPGGGGYGKP